MLEFELSWDHSPFTRGEFSASIVDLAHYLNFSRVVGRRVGGKGVNPGSWNLLKGWNMESFEGMSPFMRKGMKSL